MLERYLKLITKRKWLVIGALILLSFTVLDGFNYLKTNYHMRYWLDSDDVLIKRLNYFEDNFGNDETVVIAVHNPNGILNEKDLVEIKKLSNEVEGVKDVRLTQSLASLEVPISLRGKPGIQTVSVVDFNHFDPQLIRKRIHSNSYVPDLFISKDANTAIVFAVLKPTIISDGKVFEEIDYRGLTTSLRQIIKKYSRKDFQLYLSGSPILQNDFSAISEKDLMLIMPLLTVFLGIILYLFFRSFLILMIAFGIISLTNTFVYGLAGMLGFEFENMLSIVPLITLTICLADIVHIYMTYYQERVAGKERQDAINISVKENFVPTFLTSLTTGIGFFSLANSKLVPVSNMGILAGIGVMIAWVLSISLFPILLGMGKKDRFKTSRIIQDLSFKGVLNATSKYTNQLIILFIMVAVVGTFLGFKNQVNTDPLTFFKKETEVRKASDFIISNIGSVSGPELIIHSGYREGILEPKFLKLVDQFTTWLKKNQYIDKTISVVGIGKEINRTLNQGKAEFYKIPDTKKELVDLIFDNQDKLQNMMDLSTRISSDFESIRLSLLWSLTDTRSSLDRLAIIKMKAKELGLSIGVTGKNALYLEMNDYVVNTFFSSIGIAIIAICFLMIFIFRSVKFGLISMLPNLVPLGFIVGIMTLTGIHIDIGTSLVCSVCLGIAIDDTIHFLISYYRQRKIHGTEEAIKNVLNNTGRALGITSFILVFGFGFFMLSNFIPNIKFGFLCSLAITMALLTDFFFLPAVLLKLDKQSD